MSHGLLLLGSVIGLKDRQILGAIIEKHIYLAEGIFFGVHYDRFISRSLQREERLNHHSSQHDKEEHRDILIFLGDHLSDDGKRYPPLTWTMIWNGTYSTLVGDVIPQVMRKWGYIIWDASTLERVGGRGLLMQQWKAIWEDDDPRDFI
jgi:hypothetical protein